MPHPGRPWDSWLELLASYKREHGHVRVPALYTLPDGTALGRWLARRRRDYREGTLSAARVKSLRALGVNFGPPRDETNLPDGYTIWDERVAALKAYRAQHGHVRIPVQYRTRDGVGLGQWLSQQRVDFRRGRLSEERAATLRELGVDFRLRNPEGPGSWENWLALLKAYRAEFGDTDVPPLYETPNGERLGNWLLRQRQTYWRGTLSEDRITALRELDVLMDRRTERRPHNRKPRPAGPPPWRPKNWPAP